MKKRILGLGVVAATLSAWGIASAAPDAATSGAAAPRYDPKETFAPLTLPGAVNRYRSGDGAPGPDYWQNRADYDIKARLDPATKTLTATEVVSYVNNSPDRLTASGFSSIRTSIAGTPAPTSPAAGPAASSPTATPFNPWRSTGAVAGPRPPTSSQTPG